MNKLVLLIVLMLVFSSSVSFANEASSEKHAKTAVQFRQALLQLVRSNMGPLGAMAKGQIEYNAVEIQKNALRIEQLGLMMSDYFDVDTRKFDVKTEAADSIWEQKSEFNSKAQDLVEAAISLKKIAVAKDEASYRKGIGAVGAACKACHDKFKTD